MLLRPLSGTRVPDDGGSASMAVIVGWTLLALVALGFATELVTLAMGARGIRNLWVIHFYTLLEYVLLVMIFGAWHSHNPRMHSILLLSGALFALFWLGLKWTGIEPFIAPVTYTHSVSSALLTIVATVTLVDIARLPETVVYRDARFWVSVGVLLNYTTNVVLFLVMDWFVNLPRSEAAAVWTIRWVASAVMNVCFAIAYLCMQRERQTVTS